VIRVKRLGRDKCAYQLLVTPSALIPALEGWLPILLALFCVLFKGSWTGLSGPGDREGRKGC
jgi:hypothetical protein